MVAFLTSVLTALVVAGVLAAFKSRWLYVISPKYFLTTPLSTGQVISLSIYNAGFLSEEDVVLAFRPGIKVELIAASKSTLLMKGAMIVVPKLSKGESVEVILLVEGKPFEYVDIESIESKATNGKVVASKEKALSFWQNIVAIPLVLVLFGIPFAFGTFIGAETKKSVFENFFAFFQPAQVGKQLAGYKSSINERFTIGKLDGVVKSGLIKISTIEVLRRGDVLEIATKIHNGTKSPIFMGASLSSSAGGSGPLSFSDQRVENFGLSPDEDKIILQKAFLPESLPVKIIRNSFDFGDIDGNRASADQTLSFD